MDKLTSMIQAVHWTQYFFGILIFLSFFCPLEEHINTSSPIRLFGFIIMGVGAIVAISGQQNMTVWVGLGVVILTYLVDFIEYARKRNPKYDRRSKP